MEATIEIAGQTFIVEYLLEITASGYPETGPSYSSGGEPAGPAEFDISILGLRVAGQHADVHFDMPTWLEEIIATHLAERDDINDIAQRMDHESGYDDPDYERDVHNENRELERD